MILPENGNPKGKQETGKINRGHFWDLNSSNGNSLKKYENSLDGGNKYHNTLWTGQRSGKFLGYKFFEREQFKKVVKQSMRIL